jgi:hypothetical protein
MASRTVANMTIRLDGFLTIPPFHMKRSNYMTEPLLNLWALQLYISFGLDCFLPIPHVSWW